MALCFLTEKREKDRTSNTSVCRGGGGDKGGGRRGVSLVFAFLARGHSDDQGAAKNVKRKRLRCTCSHLEKS